MPEASISMLNLQRRFRDGDLQPSETLQVDQEGCSCGHVTDP
jgi:hypothetical protein